MKAQRETWFCSSKTQHWATSEQSVNTSFLGIRETPGTSEAETCVGVLAVLPSICQNLRCSCTSPTGRAVCQAKILWSVHYIPRSPPFPRRKWKNLSLHTHILTSLSWNSARLPNSPIKENLPRDQHSGLWFYTYFSKLYLPQDMLTFDSHISHFLRYVKDWVYN